MKAVPTWWEAWKWEREAVGRAMHNGWKRQKILNGFADHPDRQDLQVFDNFLGRNVPVCSCHLDGARHHPDMVDWDELPLTQQKINYEGGREGFRLGFEAGVRASAEKP